MGLGRKKGPGGGGGVGAVLTVTAPAGVTVSVSKDGKTKTKTANSEGLAVFTGLETGTWTLTITDGVQTSTKTVVITADYDTVIAFFSATINITYPSGSTCTCSDGSTTFTAPDTSGTWACVVPNTGTWTVSCTDGTESKSETVTITADGQSVAVKLAYWNGELFANGDQFTDITGGWKVESQAGMSMTPSSSSIVFEEIGATARNATAYTKSKIDISNYTAIIVSGMLTDPGPSGDDFSVGLTTTNNNPVPGAWVAKTTYNKEGLFEISVDISSISGQYYFAVYAHQCDGEVYTVVMK